MTFTAEPLSELPDLWLITPNVFPDERGHFLETWQADKFRNIGIDVAFVQDNQSSSHRGVLRGLHFQLPPHAQAKLVRVVSGEVFDVAVDIRRSSPTFGKWAGQILSDATHQMLWIPTGFAHGYIALSDHAIVAYKASAVYAADAERSLRWDDGEIGIEWPEVDGGPILSSKDIEAPVMSDADIFP